MQTEMQRDRQGMAVAAACVALGAYVLWEARSFTTFGAVFPRFVAVAMILFSIGIIVQSLFRKSAATPAAGGSRVRPIALIGLMAVWIALIPPLGFLPATLLGFAGASLLAKYERWTARDWLLHAAIALVVVVGAYAVFAWGLQVPFP